jgi:hypothetical protein
VRPGWRVTAVVLALLAAGSLSMRAQGTTKKWRIGLLLPQPRPQDAAFERDVGQLVVRLSELGYVEGSNLAIDWRFVPDYTRLSEAASELVQLRVDAIVTGAQTW